MPLLRERSARKRAGAEWVSRLLPRRIPARAGGGTITITAAPRSAPARPFPAPGVGATGGSEIYRIAPDGAPSRLWSSHEDLVYALGFDQHGTPARRHRQSRPHFRHQRRRRFHRSDQSQRHADHRLRRRARRRAVRFEQQPGQDFRARSRPESEGTYESDVFDAHVFSLWGRASVRAAANSKVPNSNSTRAAAMSTIPIATGVRGRASIGPPAGAELKIPPARFVQWKTVLHAGNAAPRRRRRPAELPAQERRSRDRRNLRCSPDTTISRLRMSPAARVRAQVRGSAFRASASGGARPRFDRHTLVGA
jgi:hypothetical protein